MTQTVSKRSFDSLPARLAAVAALTFLFVIAGMSQPPTEDLSGIAPPPARTISDREKDLLQSQPDTKKLTKIALELMEERMKKAEEADSRDQFPAMFIELGVFHGLMDYTLKTLLKKHAGGKKGFGDFKRFEQGLRGYTPRLELIRRDLPIRYEYYVRSLVKNLREARSKAIDPMFGDSVVDEDNENQRDE